MESLRLHQASVEEARNNGIELLAVPQHHGGQRSRSFDSASHEDSAAAFLEVPKRFQRRRSSNSKTPPPCIHCQYLDEYERAVGAEKRFFIDHIEVKSLSYSSDMSSSDDDDESSIDDLPKFGPLLLPPIIHSPGITFTLSPTNTDCPTDFPLQPPPFVGSPPATPGFPISPTIELACFDDTLPPTVASRQRRRSISRQEAIFVEPTGNSLENMSDADKENRKREEQQQQQMDDDGASNGSTDIVQDIYLTVPDLKRDRAASVDSCFSKVGSSKTEELQPPDGGFTLEVPVNSCATRSRSVDIVLPTNEQARYKALAMAGPSATAYLSYRYV